MEVSRVKRKWPENPVHELEAFDYIFENADVQELYKDMSGSFDAYGRANFHIYIDDEELANKLADDGLYVKIIAPKNEGDPVRWRLKMLIDMSETWKDGKPRTVPEIHYIDSITHVDRVLPNIQAVGTGLDGHIKTCDIQAHPKWYDKAGNCGYNLYVEWGQFVVEENEARLRQRELSAKYAPEDPDMPF